ncbi:hypothetical protein, variant 2 [Aphanomyces astaci]|uniref:Uncharacterized protein n=1 Tax=Aphanomyces astaci TaxID=112090 RepID=W4FV91_APHAT|nr:hypothetical protein, variant 2 [Aphanomyces astaci]ETV70871.1 hypothetical protein, variant 2 [Aphanomyces astaci]|eukprot:XP_009839533.1 hypothetical protein, variant 2 [Aphanomyces astaci]
MATKHKKRGARAAFKEETTSPITKFFNPVASPKSISRVKSSPRAIEFPNAIISAAPIVLDVTQSLSPPSPRAGGARSTHATVTPPSTSRHALSSSLKDAVGSNDDVFDVCTPLQHQRFKRRMVDQKPITPSSTSKSCMNNSLVFDIVTSLSTNDPDVANSALRSVVALGKEYPTPLLFEELLDQMQNESTYARAMAIFSSMIFVYEQASQCHTTLAFPAQWTRMNDVLCDVVLKPVDDKWLRSLLVVQFMVHYFARDMALCEQRLAATNKDWIGHTRLSVLLTATLSQNKQPRGRVQNPVILAAVGRVVALWVRVYDSGDVAKAFQVDGREGCLAATRLLEMLLRLTDQKDNAMQKLQMGLQAMQRSTRLVFLQTLQSPTYKMMLATTVLGRTTVSRCKDMEWFACIAEEASVTKALPPHRGTWLRSV